jgi:hypothetical protein
VASLKNTYNAAVTQLHDAAKAISQAVSACEHSAGAAARAIRSAIDHDGLNPSGFFQWLSNAAGDVTRYISSHWVEFVSDLANIAGIVATACGIIALVLAFIPGMQAFAAAFETVALLAQIVAFACHIALALTGHGSWLDVGIDAIGLVTFGIGKGLIGGAEATVEIAEMTNNTFVAAITADGTLWGFVDATNEARNVMFKNIENVDMAARTMGKLKDVVSVRPVFSAAKQALQDGKPGAALGGNPLGTLGRGFREAIGMKSPEIAESLAKVTEATADMGRSSAAARLLTSRVESSQNAFRPAQGTGIAVDLTSKVDMGLNTFGVPLPGYDNLKALLDPSGGG